MARARTKADYEPEAVARSDAYVGMLLISLLAMIVGCVLLFMDYSQYPDAKAPAVSAPPRAPVPGAAGAEGAVPP